MWGIPPGTLVKGFTRVLLERLGSSGVKGRSPRLPKTPEDRRINCRFYSAKGHQEAGETKKPQFAGYASCGRSPHGAGAYEFVFLLWKTRRPRERRYGSVGSRRNGGMRRFRDHALTGVTQRARGGTVFRIWRLPPVS